jgi:hypothetical protein
MTANVPPAPRPSLEGSRRAEWLWWGSLFLIVLLLWCTAYNRWTLEAWRTPVVYEGDALAVLANAKAFAAGEIHPLVLKYPASLGAPFTANWTDYPSPAEGLFAWAGLLALIFGLFTGSNVIVLAGHLLAAGSFFLVSRALGYRRVLCLGGAIVFSMSRYAFGRNLSHLGPAYYWHVPLGLLVLWWVAGKESLLNDRRKVWFCIIVAFLHGIQDPYFSGLFMQFLVLASLVCAIRREHWRRILFPLGIASVVFATCVVMNLDTFYNQIANGPNSESLVRNYGALEIYALKPVELFLPIAHRLAPLEAWTHKAYLSQAVLLGESGSAYLGIIGIVGFALLLWATGRAAVLSRSDRIPSHFWLVLWVVIYAVVGGINGFLGLFGVILFRSSNRYSIVILAIVLLYLVKRLSALTNQSRPVALAVITGIAAGVAFFDQSPSPPTRAYISRVGALVASDKQIVAALEGELPKQAMIFELPVVRFPEAGPVREMMDYEHFRPYLQSHSLRFSYGNVKGRTRETWQEEAVRFGAPYLVSALEQYGFSAILINKKAYEANAATLVAELSATGHAEVLCESDDLLCLRIQPAPNPILPPEFDRNWSELEGNAGDNWRWSLGDARVVLYNQSPQPREMRLSFSLSSPRSRTIRISSNGQELFADSLSEAAPAKPVRLLVMVPPGHCQLLFHTDVPGAPPGNGDPRTLAFNVRNFTIED